MARNTDDSIEIPESAEAVARRIASAGGKLYIVGGWVRDRLLGVECKDIDFATDLPTEKVKEALEGLGSLYTIGERFGTVGLRLDDYTFEITTLRADTYEPGSRHPEVAPVEDILEDLARRDFTINAMAVQVAPVRGGLIDPFDGAGDVERRLIRTPGPPAPRMSEDPLRMMRAVRFASQLGFEIEAGLLRVLEADSGLLAGISQERRRDELELILVAPHAPDGLRALVDTGLMEHVAHEIAAMKGVEQPAAYHRADVLEHTLLTVSYARPGALLRRAALFHDVGKPAARVTDPKVMFPEHQKVGAELTGEAMRRLRYSNDDIQRTVFLVRVHMRPIYYEPGWKDSAVRRLVRDCTLKRDDTVLVSLAQVIELARADVKAGNLDKVPEFFRLLDDLERRVSDVGLRREVEEAHSPLDGKELMDLFGREPGPWLREVKDHLKGLVIDGSLAQDDKEEAERLAREFLR